MIPVVNGPFDVWVPKFVVPRSNGDIAAPVISYRLNIASPIPTSLNATVMPLSVGAVAALAA